MIYRDDLLRAAKGAQRKTNPEIAATAGVSVPTVSAVLNGDPNVKISTLQAVADALGVSMTSLVQLEKVA
jgi:transcriptional regulator with XRE-family HTH domain